MRDGDERRFEHLVLEDPSTTFGSSRKAHASMSRAKEVAREIKEKSAAALAPSGQMVLALVGTISIERSDFSNR